jgi:hypothetical protein
MMAQPGLGKIPLPPRPSFTALVLLASQSEKIEETLCVSLRMLEERRKSAANMLRRKRAQQSYTKRAKETAVYIERIRSMLLAREAG